MVHYRKSFEVIGYTYDADIHCPDCALQRFTDSQLAGETLAEDSEGNPIHPIFLDSEWDYAPACGDCLELLDW